MSRMESFSTSARREILPPCIIDEIKESEQIILGRILWNPELIDAALKKITYRDFRYERHQFLYSAMSELKNEGIPIDVVSLCEFLWEKNLMDRISGGVLYVLFLVETVLADRIKELDGEIDFYLEIIRYKGEITNGRWKNS